MRALSAVEIDHRRLHRLFRKTEAIDRLPTIFDAPKTEHDPPSTTLGRYNCRRHFESFNYRFYVSHALQCENNCWINRLGTSPLCKRYDIEPNRRNFMNGKATDVKIPVSITVYMNLVLL